MSTIRNHSPLRADLLLVAGLVILGVAARLLPHEPGIWPLAASALFAGRMLHRPMLALIVPVAATVFSNIMLPGEDWRITLIVCAAIALPAFAGMLIRGRRGVAPVVLAMLPCSLVFFAATNFAVWAFGTLYSHDWQGLVECYVLALPFLARTVIGDLAWCGVLFGGAWLVRMAPRAMPARTNRILPF